MPQPGTNGMEPIFGEAYGTHRCIMTLESFPASPLGGSTEHDQKESLQGVVLMLGSPAVPRKRPFELLSDLVDDGFIEDLHHEHWDVSALDDISRYTKGSPEGELPSSDGMLMGRGGSVAEPAEQALAVGASSSLRLHSAGQTGAIEPGMALKPTAHADPVAQGQEEVGEAGDGEAPQSLGASTSSPSAPEHCSEEHNYSLQAERDSSSSQSSDSETVDTEEEEEEEEGGSDADEDATKGMDFRISGPECDQDPDAKAGVRQRKRRCFWEYRHSHEAEGNSGACKLPLSWSSSTLPSTLYLREGTSSSGKKCPRKARKTDANDLTPNPQKLRSIGEQLLKLNLAIEGMRPVNDLPVVARARSRKEKNKLASRACRLKKKAQHEANKIKLWGLNQEYDNLLAALLRIKEGIRRRVESSEEEDKVGMTKKLQDILKESAGPHVAGRTKEFVERILDCSAAGQGTKRA